jgi:hypothetical protein
MKYTTLSGRTIDTDRDLTAPERHVLQKLFLWESLAGSLREFREQKSAALERGWNDSGPVPVSGSLKNIISDLEQKVRDRLDKAV